LRALRSPKLPIFFHIFLLLIFDILIVVYASPDLQITVNTDKQTYWSNDLVHIYGDLKRDGAPITDALVAVQVSDAQNNIVSIRTCSTGTTPSPWSITITELISCDQSGNPKGTFAKGTLAYFKITVKNLNTLSERYVKVTINLYDSNQVPFGMAWVGITVGPDKEFTYLTSIPVPSDASIGTAYAFANAYNKWPKDNGIAYCGEEAVAFTITDGTSSSSSNDPTSSESTGSEGIYQLTFKLSNKPALGDHSVYASYYQALATAILDVVWLFTDLDRNGKVDVLDIALAAKAYGSYLGHPRWNPKADLDGNGAIDILDIAKVARDFGEKRT